jgi:hypothetical protein
LSEVHDEPPSVVAQNRSTEFDTSLNLNRVGTVPKIQPTRLFANVTEISAGE